MVLEFSFQTLLACLLMTHLLSMLHSNSLVLVESKSCIFWVFVFYVIVVILWWVIRKSVPPNFW